VHADHRLMFELLAATGVRRSELLALEVRHLASSARRLAAHVAGRDERELMFRSTVGTILDPDNVADRVLAPACAAAGVEWAGFHTFRHTVASRLFAEGRNVVQVQRWLGNRSPFTLNTYVTSLRGLRLSAADGCVLVRAPTRLARSSHRVPRFAFAC
jgi:integrase